MTNSERRALAAINYSKKTRSNLDDSPFVDKVVLLDHADGWDSCLSDLRTQLGLPDDTDVEAVVLKMKEAVGAVILTALEAKLNITKNQLVAMPNKEFRALVKLGSALNALTEALAPFDKRKDET